MNVDWALWCGKKRGKSQLQVLHLGGIRAVDHVSYYPTEDDDTGRGVKGEVFGGVEGDVAKGGVHPCCKNDSGRSRVEVRVWIEECRGSERGAISKGECSREGHDGGCGGVWR